MDVQGLRNQLKTWSSVHTYMEKHKPSVHAVDELVDGMREILPQEGDFKVEWPSAVLLMKKQMQ